ncbi:MAG TPA: nitrite/sulfite reductase [Anaeromyxobacter sp.]|nr:nitrite/sulfite reductase [Anaeromyxobacter sp.]
MLARADAPSPPAPAPAREPFTHRSDVDEFVEMLGRFERGELGAEAWRQFRLLRGTYGQRQADVHMQRIKLPQGVLSAEGLEAIADVSEAHSRGFAHVTTRQNVQLHFVTARGAEEAMRRLAEAGITTREACGNSVRNVTACPLAGVAPDEVFDPTPYAEAFTRHFLRHPLSSSLPRKFKVAFEGCPVDHAATSIHDLGFVARLGADGRRSFLVRAAGGTATVPVSGAVLAERLPAGDLLELAEAVVRLFHRRGDRVRRHANRMKFLVRELGFDGFRAEVEAERARVRAEGAPGLPFDPESPPEPRAPAARLAPPSPERIAARVRSQAPRGPGVVPPVAPALRPDGSALAAFARTNVRGQRQAGFVTVHVVLPLGDVTSAQLRVLADLARAYGDGEARLTREQDVVLRWIRREHVPALHARLAAAGLARDGAGTAANVTSCPGAESCKLAVTQSRGLGRLLEAHVPERPHLASAAPGLELKVSGCPNGCGQHHVAAIGFQGSARKVAGRAVPQYFVLVGGGLGAGGARFGRLAAKIPARRVPEALERLVALYRAERGEGEDAPSFFARVDPARARAALADLAELAPEAVRPEDLVDLGESAEFRPETGEGECAT